MTGSRPTAGGGPRLGIRANLAQFVLLVVVNGLVGAMVGMERTVLPAMAEERYALTATAAVLAFIAVFGVSKALTNYVAGRLADAHGRKKVLVAGWLVAVPVPFLLMYAPTWGWVLAANLLLGVSQGLTWSTAVVMKIDLAGPARRGLAMGLNEFAGYAAVAASALVSGWLAATWGLGAAPFTVGVAYVAAGLAASVFLVRETAGFTALEAPAAATAPAPPRPSARAVFWRTTAADPTLSAATQAGLVNNLNDGLAWGLFPLLFAAAGLDLATIAGLAAIYPAVWGVTQLGTGALSDRIGRKGLIVGGMLTQAAGIGVVAVGATVPAFAAGQALLGLGTAMVYPTLLAAVADVAAPSWRGAAVGVYRLWRDLGYAAGAVVAGVVADRLGLHGAAWVVAGLTAASGLVVLARMREPHDHVGPAPQRGAPPTYASSTRYQRRHAPTSSASMPSEPGPAPVGP